MTPTLPKPRIAIPVPTSDDLEYNRQSWHQYALAVERSGGEPVAVPLTATAAETTALVGGCQGVLLPGSPADVDPAKYGHDRIEECAPADPAREAVDTQLIEDAYRHRKPLLTICFGTQMLNVWHGGTLVQDLTCMPVNHKAGKTVMTAHFVAVAPDSLLGSLLLPEEAPEKDGFLRLPVNSSHHQAIGEPGEDLRIVGRSIKDGVIEAVEGPTASDEEGGHFVLGVQWHPERTLDTGSASSAIFVRFLAEARVWAERPVAV
jgi:putative glutamine amidotransferase